MLYILNIEAFADGIQGSKIGTAQQSISLTIESDNPNIENELCFHLIKAFRELRKTLQDMGKWEKE